MKIVLIRHAKVNYKWKHWYKAQEFNVACREYDLSKIDAVNKYNIDTSNKIYISELLRTYETASLIFGEKSFLKMNLFNEVSLNAFTNKSVILPVGVWNVIGRIQWYVNSKKQFETKKQTYERARKTIEYLEDRNEDCFIVCHGFYMRVLLREFKTRGYIGDYSRVGIKNLQSFTIIKE